MQHPPTGTIRPMTVPRLLASALVCCLLVGTHAAVWAEGGSAAVSKTFDIPAGPLTQALNRFAQRNGLVLVFDPVYTNGKSTAGLKGIYGIKEGFAAILKGSGLEAVEDGKGGYRLKLSAIAIEAPAKPEKTTITIDTVRVRAKRYKEIGPMPGLALEREQIAGNIQSVSAEEIRQNQSLSLTDLLNTKLQSVNVNDYQGNPFQMDLTYRGFTAGPQIGSQQGLSVFFDGIRVNEPFGDVVNWDMIPMNAIAGLDVFPGSNPLFGLNTLGGAISVKTKSGFDSPGVSAQILEGDYGRKQFQGSAGWNNDTYAAFGAVNLFMEDGWRDNSPSKVNQAFGKLEWRGERASLGLTSLIAVNKLVGNGTIPTELYKEDPAAVFTSPDETRNRLLQFQLSGVLDVSDTFNITGMVYNRNSKRTSSTGDIIDVDTFRDLGSPTRRAAPGELISCVLQDDDGDGLPNYYLDELTQDAMGNWTSPFIQDAMAHTIEVYNGTYTPDVALLGPLNPGGLPSSFFERVRAMLNSGTDLNEFNVTDSLGQQQRFSGSVIGSIEGVAMAVLDTGFVGYPIFYTRRNLNGTYTRFNVIFAPIVNPDCGTKAFNGDQSRLYALDANGNPIAARDGAIDGHSGSLGTGTGYIQGTPTAVITNSLIDQSGQGGALQFNWNLDDHKFMVGFSLDRAGAKYHASQRFGLLDDKRNVYNDPESIGEEYYAASHDVLVNAFDGTSTTKSLYFSETWTPKQTLNLNASARYNITKVVNALAPKARYYELTDPRLINNFLSYVICTGSGFTDCNFDPRHEMAADEFRELQGFGPFVPLDSAITERFTFRSLNPALGGTWQATPRLNLYANWNQGTRVPSVIELGCAYDATPTVITNAQGTPILDGNGKLQYGPRTLVDGRACNLPTVLSGDPALPQIRAQTVEFGARGKFKDLLEWNLTAYRTDLQDDIYMVAATSQLSYFQDVGSSRRQGIEFGVMGGAGKHEFRLNYALTEATFQSTFKMLSANNSSIISNDTSSADYNQIQVEPGDRMPGIPLNNLNFSWGYKATPNFKIGLSVVAHGDAFVRGNENNEHTPGPGRGVVKVIFDPTTNTSVRTLVPGPDYRYSGKTPGYAVFNLRASYDLGKGWSAGLMVNNLFDKKYTSAGRLGLTPFSPSTHGAVGPGGFNYNSSEWLSTQFISGGAPRGMWFTVAYDFDASKKTEPPKTGSAIMNEPDRLLEPAARLPSAEETALSRVLDTVKPMPVLKRDLAQSVDAIKTARQQVASVLEAWKTAWAKGDAEAYLGYYSPQFQPEGMGRAVWEEQRKLQLLTAAGSTVTIDHLMIAPQGKGMVAMFTQNVGGRQPVSIRKMVALEQQGGEWLIVREHDPQSARQKAVSTAEPVQYQAVSQQHEVTL